VSYGPGAWLLRPAGHAAIRVMRRQISARRIHAGHRRLRSDIDHNHHLD
jgi:hypothetical protein